MSFTQSRPSAPAGSPDGFRSTIISIGPKDLLEITVFELPELNQTVRVSEDGSITLSLARQGRGRGIHRPGAREPSWPSSSDQTVHQGRPRHGLHQGISEGLRHRRRRPAGHVRARRAHDPPPGHRPGRAD
ncbi:MAG: polysaccharide biosynthesis/export family protein [Desulfosudis oleivorans]|nr:polysaccharide biosynthesis/export family protein [Desulfosudis oleivorans]